MAIWFFDKPLFPAKLRTMILSLMSLLHSSISRVRLIRCWFGVVFVSAALAVECSGGEWIITNYSFENTAVPDGGFVNSVPGWIQEGTTVTYNPNNSHFSNTSTGSSNSPIHGINAAAVNAGGKLTYQDPSWIIRTNFIYELTFLAGYRIGVPLGNPSVTLWAGTNLLAEKLPTPAENTFAPHSLSYTSPASGPVIGLPLRMELRAIGTDSQAWFDNFHLLTNSLYCTPHKATATAQLSGGALVEATIVEPGCGYTSAPPVLIQGGGGNGATATAVISNGAVVSIQVTAGGCCYTNLPKVVIGSPPFVPWVSVSFSKVNVVQNVVLGRNYVLESSLDLITWTNTGPSFTAISELYEDEFDVDVNGHYFRLREVP
jgi:hypothetical protein